MPGRLWADLWPNVVAPSLWTLLGIALSHARMARAHRRTQTAVISAAGHARAARAIAADTHLALTGREHPDAPPRGA